MGVSRPVLLALLGAVIVGVLYVATMGARQSESGSAAPPAPAAKESTGAGSDKAKAGSTEAKTSPNTKTDSKERTSASGKSSTSSTSGTPPKADSSPDPKTSSSQDKAAQEPKTDPKKSSPPAGIPAELTSALAAKRTVVLFFYQPGAADDDATAKAVHSLRGVKVFSVPMSHLSDYKGLTGAAGVSQAPAVVIIGHGGRARLIEGYIDEKSLAQEVADAR